MRKTPPEILDLDGHVQFSFVFSSICLSSNQQVSQLRILTLTLCSLILCSVGSVEVNYYIRIQIRSFRYQSVLKKCGTKVYQSGPYFVNVEIRGLPQYQSCREVPRGHWPNLRSLRSSETERMTSKVLASLYWRSKI